MSLLSPSNPLSCFLNRQIDNRLDFCQRLIDFRLKTSENLFRKDLLSHYGCVNAIEFLKDGDLIVSGGDDRRVLLWKVQQSLQGLSQPVVMRAQHTSNIFCLGHDSSNSKIFSAGNDDQVIVHDINTRDPVDYFLHEKPVYGLSIHPENDHVFSSAGDDGRVLIYDIREPSGNVPFCLAQHNTPFHSVMFNPVEPRKLATANAEAGVSMWDVRKPMLPVMRYGLDGPIQSCMNVTFNSDGTKLLALKRRLPPVLYSVDSPTFLCHFDQCGYYNSCTMKSCCFAGKDESYILSGSDDFNLYIWKIPKDDESWVKSAHMVLRGHRSIVNHVRYNPRHCILASSGVEKLIKIWSPFSLENDCMGGLGQSDGKWEKQRRVFTHEDYLQLVLRTGQIMTHDYSHQSTKEDPRMMAFFDSLVQREIEGWRSEDGRPYNRLPTYSLSTPTIEQNYTGTDSDDSSGSETHLLRTVFGTAKICSRSASRGGVAPERPYDSPNRITRLIRNCHKKLMHLVALEGESIVAQRLSFQTSSSTSSKNQKRKTPKPRSKVAKRKQTNKVTTRRANKARRKYNNLKIISDSESESNAETENREENGDFSVVDAAEPSTSSGLSSRRSTYLNVIPEDSDQGHSSDEGTPAVKQVKDNDGVSVEKRPRKCKEGEKRGKVTGKGGRGSKNRANGDVIPLKKGRKVLRTPDSGINSGLSEEKETTRAQGTSVNGEHSDSERTIKVIENCRRKVDCARRGYKKKSGCHTEGGSDSSD